MMLNYCERGTEECSKEQVYLAEASEEGYSSNTAVVPLIMMMYIC